jgi:histidine triad (HIT) family protein
MIRHTCILAPARAPATVKPTTDCIFDRIAEGRLAAHVVLEEGPFMAFLDHRPLFAGHTLVVPRHHYATLADLPDDLVGPLFVLGRRVGAALRRALGAQGAFLALNDEVSQSVPHVHLHVVPRTKGDGLRGFFWPRTPYRDDAHAESVAASIRAALATDGPDDAGHPPA